VAKYAEFGEICGKLSGDMPGNPPNQLKRRSQSAC